MRHECAHCSDSDCPHPCEYMDGLHVQRPLRCSLDLSKEIFKLEISIQNHKTTRDIFFATIEATCT